MDMEFYNFPMYIEFLERMTEVLSMDMHVDMEFGWERTDLYMQEDG
jgi:hypothetical protein